VDVREPTLLRTIIAELAHSTQSAQSGGELNRSFKFGGRPKNSNSSPDHELTLSDIIPLPEFAHAISKAFMLDDLEDDSVLWSIQIYAKLMMNDLTL